MKCLIPVHADESCFNILLQYNAQCLKLGLVGLEQGLVPGLSQLQ